MTRTSDTVKEANDTVKESDGRQKPPTLQDVAKLAGFHSRTVADALRGTGRVAPATREKVHQIARDLNYFPNPTARALATGRTGTVAVLSGPLNEYFYANMVHLLEGHLTANKQEMLLLHTGREMDDLVQRIRTSLVDGVIVVGNNHLAWDLFGLLDNSFQPCVFINTSSLDFVDHIILDLRPAIEETLQRMLSAGCQRIAYVINNRDAAADTEVRLATYLQLMKRVSRIPELIDVDTTKRPEDRSGAVKAYIEQNGCPDALFCQNDETAMHTFRAISDTGRRIPDDVLLAGCDGLPYMELFEPPLSTIALPTPAICATAVQFLQKRMTNHNIPLQKAAFKGHLLLRKSLVT